MNPKQLISLALLVLAGCASSDAASSESSLREKITLSLEEFLESRSHGIENCENKCDKAFNRLAYQISAADGKRTYEFQACLIGCNQCQSDLANNGTHDNCFRTCKNYDWSGNNIVKGVIEPDKACIGGCVINTCQVICAGGTTDPTPNPTNKKYFYPNGGCSIKTEPYSQYSEYVPWNSPVGAGADNGAKQCCANAMSLCQYVGNKATTNYAQLLDVTTRLCAGFSAGTTETEICAFFNNPQTCGGTVPAG